MNPLLLELAVMGLPSARLVVLLVPEPVSETVSGCGVVELAMLSVPVWVPAEVGAKRTLMVHEAPAASWVGQLLVCVNCPLTDTDDTLAGPVPGLLMVTGCGELVWPTRSEPNASDDGLTVRALVSAMPRPTKSTQLTFMM